MFKKIVLLLFVLTLQSVQGQIILTHNVGTTPIETEMYSCEEDEGWSRVFKLSDFGIKPNEQFHIKSGEVAFSKSSSGAYLQFNVYSIDDDFPVFFYSLYPRTLLGARGIGKSPVIDGAPEIVKVDFEEPIVVPAGVDRILVTVIKIDEPYNPESAEVIIAGTAEDTGESWYEGCEENYRLTPTTELTRPIPEANFYINVTGDVLEFQATGSTTRLTHNVCDDIIKTDIHSCKTTYIYWARDFILEDFGISEDEEYVISSGQVGIVNTGWKPEIQFNIYEIDENFPASFSEADLIGSSQVQQISPNIGNSPVIIQVDFETPIVIPAGVKRILVEVHKGIVYGDGVAFIAGSTQDTGKSWQRYCTPGTYGEYISTAEFGYPDANFYINVTGKVNHLTNKFQMMHSAICSEILKQFSIDNQSEAASILWNFGDPASGTANTTSEFSPFHDFSANGNFSVTATVTGKDGTVEVLTERIEVTEPPKAYKIDNLEVCEDSFGTGVSGSFDTSRISAQVLGNQTGMVVSFVDGSGNHYDQLPNPFTNTVKERETMKVRVARTDNSCCFSEITFDLIVNPLPDLSTIEDIYVCDAEDDGFTSFDLTPIHSALSVINTVDFYFQDAKKIPDSMLDAVVNRIKDQETLTVRVTSTATGCYNETVFLIAVTPPPAAYAVADLIGCDDNNDGISEYFNTSEVERTLLGDQTGMQVTYYSEAGTQLPGPLPNPYTNSKVSQERITLRVTDPLSGCYAETFLNLLTSSKPRINTPMTLFACDSGDGTAVFDTSEIEEQLTGNQPGLRIFYSDEEGNPLPSPLPLNYQTKSRKQTIHIRVENEASVLCYSETRLELLVNEVPEIELQQQYFLCDLEPSLSVAANPAFDSWTWTFEDGSVISESSEAQLTAAGTYSLLVSETRNGVSCENSFSFELVRSVLPKIQEIRVTDLSDDNSIEITTTGDGDFEYSIDGAVYQESNRFHGLAGGIYTVQVRDRKGCGSDSREVVLVDYPRLLTPNNDGYNDSWHIAGVKKFPGSRISIFDRYGKLLKLLTAEGGGWDGSFNGKPMPSDDYWFQMHLSDGRMLKGHFSLVR